MTTQDENKFVCHNCVDDEILSNEVSETGECAQCSYCEETTEAWALERLAHRIDEVLQEHFVITVDYEIGGFTTDDKIDWVPRGNPVEDVVAEEIAMIDYDIALDVVRFLSAFHALDVVKNGATHLCQLEAHYEDLGPNDLGFQYSWVKFRKEIGERARFFNDTAEEILDDIFGDITQHRTNEGKPVIREIKPDDTQPSLWRGRKVESEGEVKRILATPSLEISPPPSDIAKSGRMNAEGISVFYGAFEKETCVAEVRPPVGGYVVLAKFEILRTVRLLDLELLSKLFAGRSHFAPEYAIHRGRAAFLEYLVSEICRPVMPMDETSEYLPTQVIAEYLANKGLDGIIFRSSQTGGQGRNVVIFNHACRVDPKDGLPDSDELEITLPISDDEDDREIVIWQRSIDASSDEQESSEDDESNDLPDNRELTLRIVPKSVSVLKITAVKYNYDEHTITRFDRSELPPYPVVEMPSSLFDELLE